MTFTKERIIEDLKSSTQNASGMFEISEETICALMSLLAAPPSPVVPDAISTRQAISKMEEYAPCDSINVAFKYGWNACRAAMLQGADGNSPVIPEGFCIMPKKLTAEQMRAVQINSELGAYAAANLTGAYSMFREFWDVAVAAAPDFREIVNSSTNNCRENAETSTKCWCRTCRPVTIADMRFVVCPECGNKRCPHANDHRNACTGSNDPGQEGSAYPAAPQQEVSNG